jgi:Tol biopolymer transport system component
MEPGKPEGPALTKGHWDFKPSWSKSGDMFVGFRRTKDDPVTVNWTSATFIMKADGTGYHELTDGTHTDFNPTWTRDGRNVPLWNRKNPKTGGFFVMQGKVGGKPGEEIAVTDESYHTWVFSTVKDGRLLVSSTHPSQGWGLYLMSRKPGRTQTYERIDCELAKTGILDRVSVSPSEKKVCFEYQKGFEYKDPGRTLYIADFDAGRRTITNARPFANPDGKPYWIAYPRWIDGESAIVYHSYETGIGQLYVYSLADGSTKRISTDPRADYRYPHGEAAPN